MAALVFSLVAIGTRRAPKALESRAAFVDTLCLNAVTAVSWLFFYVTLTLLEPAMVVALIGAVIPLITILLNKILRPQSPSLTSEIHSAVGIFAVGGYIGWVAVSGGDTLPEIALAGLTAALNSAVGLSATTLYSKRLYDRGESTIGIMATRFWGW